MPGKPWRLDDSQVAALRSACPGPVESAFYAHEGRIVHKWAHYLPIYDRLFAPFIGKPVKILEIGVSQGGSLELWRAVFGPDATIMGIDINPAMADRVDPPNRVMIGSQDDPAFLRRVVGMMGAPDIVLDDGSHVGRHIIASFETLFPLMATRGIYLIEDLQTSYWPGIHAGGRRRKGTGVEFLKDLIDHLHAAYHDGPSPDPFLREIGAIQVFNGMAAIEKLPPLLCSGHFRRGTLAD